VPTHLGGATGWVHQRCHLSTPRATCRQSTQPGSATCTAVTGAPCTSRRSQRTPGTHLYRPAAPSTSTCSGTRSHPQPPPCKVPLRAPHARPRAPPPARATPAQGRPAPSRTLPAAGRAACRARCRGSAPQCYHRCRLACGEQRLWQRPSRLGLRGRRIDARRAAAICCHSIHLHLAGGHQCPALSMLTAAAP